MGIDAGFFAKKAKRYFWFDRLSNIEAFWHSNENSDLDLILKDTYDKLVYERGAKAPEIINFLEENIKAWMLEPEDQQYHAYWCSKSIEFIKSFPDDEFFVASDSCEVYDLTRDMNGGTESGEYSEWKPTNETK